MPDPSPRKIVIIGGGITGLALAHALTRDAGAKGLPLHLSLLERRNRLGGNIVTERHDGFLLDGGPDSWVATKPHATELVRSLGLGDEIVGTKEGTRRVYVAHGGALHPMPEGLVLGVPTRFLPVVKTRLFSIPGKLRMGMEPFVRRRRWNEGEDESIGDFVARRLGREAADRLAGPMLGGIFAGDANEISVRAAFPQLVEMEVKFGSLVRAMRAQRRPATGGKPASAFLTLRGGLGAFIEALARQVERGASVRTGVEVRAVERLPDGDARGRFAIGAGGEVMFADDVIVAGPAHGAAAVLRGLDGGLADELSAIPYASTATVFLGYRREDVGHALDGVGFIVPRSTGRSILAGTWVSSKWAGRAPDGHVLVRAFFGGAHGEGVLERDDDALVALARQELSVVMGLDRAPLFTRVFRFVRASPQPIVGHLARVARIRERLARIPGIYAVGGGYEGLGIPDCIRQAEATARAFLEGA